MPGGDIVVSLRGVHRDYQGLRPLRVADFELRAGETVALLGFDRAAAEVLVNLITAATLPDAGDIEVFGSSTRNVTDSDGWFRLLDRIGIVSERVVLLDELTVEQNLALPLSLEVDDMPQAVRRDVEQLAAETGIPAGDMRQPMAKMGAPIRTRVRLGKALAPNPRVLLAEHPNAALPSEEVPRFAADLSAVAARRNLAVLLLTADAAFASAACHRVLSLKPATGQLVPAYGWWNRLTRRVR